MYRTARDFLHMSEEKSYICWTKTDILIVTVMTEQSFAPSWLKIDDDKFRDLLEYLCRKARSDGHDPFYSAAQELLKGRVSSLMPELSCGMEVSEDEKLFRIRLLGAWLLCNVEDTHERMEVAFAMFNILASIVPEELSQKLFALSLRVLCSGGIQAPGFAWEDLVDVNKELLSHKIILNAKTLPSKKSVESWFDGKGLLHVDPEKVSIIPMNRKDYSMCHSKLSDCMSLADGRLCVYVEKGEKLKKTEESDIDGIGRFAGEFRKEQQRTVPPQSILKKYSLEQETMVRVISRSSHDIVVETVDPEYEKISGTLHHDRGIFFYNNVDFAQALEVGDCFKAVIKDKERGYFSVYDRFLKEMVSLAMEGDSILARYSLDYKGKPLWFTNEGVPVYVSDSEQYGIGDIAYIELTKVDTNGYITGIISEDQSGIEEEEPFDDEKEWFIRNHIREKDYVEPKDNAQTILSSDFVRIFERSLYNYQKTLSRASEIYKVLCYCQMLSELTSEEKELHFLELKASYLEQLVLFAKGQYDRMKQLVPPSDIGGIESVERSVKLVDILMQINSSEESELLDSTILSSEDPLTKRTARILQSYNRIKDIVPESSLNDLKMEIIRGLSLDAEIQASLDEKDDEYLGMEDKVKEFKSSFVYPADKEDRMSPNVKKQSMVVFKAVCAFLNSKVGGTLYLGVSDAGYVVGIDNDLAYLKANSDSYIRFIQDEAKKVFDKSILDFLDFDLKFDGRVVEVKVRPFDDGVVCLEGVPYIRRYAESEPMREDERARIASEKVAPNIQVKSKAENLERAIAEKKRAILRRFSSSDRIEDRKVEPFKIVRGGKYVWCYDIEDKCCKQFGISKMAAVDVIQDPWTHEAEHKEGNTDIFNWGGSKAFNIVLELDLTAKNIIVEEYPLSEPLLKQVDKSGMRWSLSTDIYNCTAPGRFCIGLAEHVTIIKGDELKKYVSEYVRKNFSGNA